MLTRYSVSVSNLLAKTEMPPILEQRFGSFFFDFSFKLAEGVGFEPTVARATTVFKTVTIDRSDTPPEARIYLSVFT